MAKLAGQAIRAENPRLPRVLGGMSPIDPLFIRRLAGNGVLDHVDAVAVHGFPLDWNLWQIDEWPAKIDEIRAVTDKPVWVTEVGVSSFGAEEVQAWGLRRTAELLIGRAPRIHWYSLYDLPQDLGGDDAPQGGRGLLLLPPLPHGPAARGRHAEAGARGVRRPRARHGPLPVVPLRGPPARRRGRLDEAARRAPPPHRPVLGRQLPPGRARAGSTGRWRRCATSTSPSPSASRPSTAASSRTTPARRRSPEEFAEFCAAMVRRYGGGGRSAAPA